MGEVLYWIFIGWWWEVLTGMFNILMVVMAVALGVAVLKRLFREFRTAGRVGTTTRRRHRADSVDWDDDEGALELEEWPAFHFSEDDLR
jgi:hypothetical protein